MKKMIDFLDLDEIGSNHHPSVFDPHGFPKESYEGELGKFNYMICNKCLLIVAREYVNPPVPQPAPKPPDVKAPIDIEAMVQKARERAAKFVAAASKKDE